MKKIIYRNEKELIKKIKENYNKSDLLEIFGNYTDDEKTLKDFVNLEYDLEEIVDVLNWGDFKPILFYSIDEALKEIYKDYAIKVFYKHNTFWLDYRCEVYKIGLKQVTAFINNPNYCIDLGKFYKYDYNIFGDSVNAVTYEIGGRIC